MIIDDWLDSDISDIVLIGSIILIGSDWLYFPVLNRGLGM